jgi:tol-pal system protein YbgF
MRHLYAAAVAACLMVSASAAWAKGEYDDRVAALERQVSTMQNTSSSNNQEVAAALARVSAFQDEFAGIKGQVEASNHLIKAQGEDLSKRVNELDHRIQAIEDRMEIFGSQITKALGKVAPQAAAEGDLYQKALDLTSSSQYLEAAAGFETFLKQFPQSSFAANAKLWIAECYFSTGDYRRAIKEYQAFIEKYPRSDKVPEAIFKQGRSFAQLGMAEDAAAFYQKVISMAPHSAAATQAQEQLERLKQRQAAGRQAAPSEGLGSYPTQTLTEQLQRQAPPSKPAAGAGKAAPQKASPTTRPPARDF